MGSIGMIVLLIATMLDLGEALIVLGLSIVTMSLMLYVFFITVDHTIINVSFILIVFLLLAGSLTSAPCFDLGLRKRCF